MATFRWRIALIGMSLALGVPSLVGLSYFGLGYGAETDSARYLMIGISAAFLVLSAYSILSTLRSKLVLYPDRIEIHQLIATHTVARNQIDGWRLQPKTITSPADFIIEQREARPKRVSTAWLYQADSEFDDWFETVPNLDGMERAATLREVVSDENLGSDVEERLGTLDRLRTAARVLNVLGVALLAWAWLYPHPYELVVGFLLAAPWVAVVMGWISGGYVQLDGDGRSPKPNLGFLVLGSTAALNLRSLVDYQTQEWTVQTGAALIIGGMLFAAQWGAHTDLRTMPRLAVFAFVLTALAHGYGAVRQINALADFSETQQTRYLVREKRTSNGNLRTYRVNLTKVHGKAPDVESAEVPEYLYANIDAGDSVCLAFRPGALSIPWFTASACPPGTP